MRWKLTQRLDKSTDHPWARWHRWFAWHPVTCVDTDEVVWLETVWRQGTFWGKTLGWEWMYQTGKPVKA